MIPDTENRFSDAQAITASAASTDIVDLGATGTPPNGAAALSRDIGKGNAIPLLIQVVETFNNLTSLDVEIQTDDNSGFSSAKTVIKIPAVPLADLVKGYIFKLTWVPRGVAERYWRIFYTVNGSAPSTGKITAGVVSSVQDTFHQI